MKKINLLLIAGAMVTAFAFQACNSAGTTNSTTAAKDSNAANDTSSMMAANKDTTSMTGVVKVDKSDADFAVEAANGGMAEVAMGKLAEQKGMSQDVKDFGARMVKDHGMANDKLKAIAMQKNITLPDSLGNDEKQMMADLSKKTGKDFDKAYVDAMVKDHKHDISAFEKEQSDAKDADLKAFVTNTLPTLKEHQMMIDAIDKKMK